MTTQEKAKELIDKFDIGEQLPYYSIKHALICVDEILKSNPTKIDCNSSELNYKYWVEVKKEIQKL